MNLIKAENSRFELISKSPEETQELGRDIGKILKKGDVVALEGGLGAGKTRLTKGIALGLCVSEEITSPTYTIISEYSGSLLLYHMDAYRLKGADDFMNLGAEELLYGNGVCVIEWSNIVEDMLPEHTIRIKIELLDQGDRKIILQGINTGT